MMPLVVLEGHGDTRLNQLAERLGLTPSTALRMVDRLIAARLVTREENEADRRGSSSA
jgi:DNA-binding MarR family transcriptional regulator